MRSSPDLAQAEAAAARLIREYGIVAPSQIIVEDIAMDLGVLTRVAPLTGAEAHLLRKGNRGVIRVSDRIAEPGRRRFAIGHELGHWELHAMQVPAWLCTSDDIHAYRGTDREIEANAFAAELLMPGSLLRPRLRRGISLSLVCELALGFQTTLTATAVRMVDESREDCYVVFSRDGRVTWWRGGRNDRGLWIRRTQEIDPNSRAYACGTLPANSAGMCAVPPEAWFPGAQDLDDMEVWEESVLLGDYDIVLTLLCVI